MAEPERIIFTCAYCHETFESAWTDEEAIAEAQATFSEVELEATEVVCDECYKAVMAALDGIREQVRQEAAAAGISVEDYLRQEAKRKEAKREGES